MVTVLAYSTREVMGSNPAFSDKICIRVVVLRQDTMQVSFSGNMLVSAPNQAFFEIVIHCLHALVGAMGVGLQ